MLYALCCSRLPYGDDELKVFVKNETPKKLMFTKNVSKGTDDEPGFWENSEAKSENYIHVPNSTKNFNFILYCD